jgi:hypothetical protein
MTAIEFWAAVGGWEQQLREARGLSRTQLGVDALQLTPHHARKKIREIEIARVRIDCWERQQLAAVLQVPPAEICP